MQKKTKGPNQESSSKLIPVELDPSPPSGFEIWDLPNLFPEWIERFEPSSICFGQECQEGQFFVSKVKDFLDINDCIADLLLWRCQTTEWRTRCRTASGNLGNLVNQWISVYFSGYVCIRKYVYHIYIYIYTWHDICFRYSMSVVHRNSTYIMPSSSLLMHIGKGKSYISTGKNSVAGTLIPISTPPSTCLMTFGRIWSDFMQWDEWRFAQNRLLTASQMTFSAHSTNLQDVLGARRWRIIHHVLN